MSFYDISTLWYAVCELFSGIFRQKQLARPSRQKAKRAYVPLEFSYESTHTRSVKTGVQIELGNELNRGQAEHDGNVLVHSSVEYLEVETLRVEVDGENDHAEYECTIWEMFDTTPLGRPETHPAHANEQEEELSTEPELSKGANSSENTG